MSTGGFPTVSEQDESHSDSQIYSDDVTQSFDEPWKPDPRDLAKRQQQIQQEKEDAREGTSEVPGKSDKPLEVVPSQATKDSPLRSPALKMLQKLENAEDKSAFLERFYTENFEKVEEYAKMCKDLVYLLAKHTPGINVKEELSPELITALISHAFDELKARFRKYQLEIGDLNADRKGMFASPEIIAKIQEHKRNVFALIETYEKQLDEAREENLQLKDNKTHLEEQIDYLQMKLIYLERGTMYQGQYEENFNSGEIEHLMGELEERSASTTERLNSTLKKELTQAQKQIAVMMRKLSVIEEESIEELANISQKSEINSKVEEALVSVLSDSAKKSPNTEDCRNVIQESARLMQEAIAESGKQLEDIAVESKRMTAQVVEKESELQGIKKQSEELDHELNMLKESYKLKKEEAKKLAESIKTLNRQVEIASQYMQDLKRLYEEKKGRYEANLDDTINGTESDRSFGHADQSNVSSKPNDQSRFSDFISRGTPESMDLSFRENSGFANTSLLGNSSPIDAGGAATKFDVNPVLNIATSPKGTPYHTTTDSSVRVPETHHMASVPLRINQTATLSPKAPWYSKNKVGYTDPEASTFNRPPEFNYGNESMKKTLLLTSPEREQPLQVDIEVNPRPLTQTESGEHFVCDISINMQEFSQSYMDEQYRRHDTYIPNRDQAPPLTTSVDGRPYGMFNPRNVFKRTPTAVRKLFGSDYLESPESPWDTSREFHSTMGDYNTDVHKDTFSPESDRSMEWEIPTSINKTFEKPQLNKTYEKPQLNKTYEKPQLNKTYEKPQLNKTYEKPQLNKTYEKSQPATRLDKTFSPQRGTPPSSQMNRTFSPQRGAPPSSQMNKTFSPQSGTQPSYQMHRTFSPQRVAPPSSQMNRTFSPPRGATPSSQMNRTFSPQGSQRFSSSSSTPYPVKDSAQLNGPFNPPQSKQRSHLLNIDYSPIRMSTYSSSPVSNEDWRNYYQNCSTFLLESSNSQTPFQRNFRSPEHRDQNILNRCQRGEMFGLPTSDAPPQRSFRSPEHADQNFLNRCQRGGMFGLSNSDAPPQRNFISPEHRDQDILNRCQRGEMFGLSNSDAPPQRSFTSPEHADQNFLNRCQRGGMFGLLNSDAPPQQNFISPEHRDQDILNRCQRGEIFGLSNSDAPPQ